MANELEKLVNPTDYSKEYVKILADELWDVRGVISREGFDHFVEFVFFCGKHEGVQKQAALAIRHMQEMKELIR